LLRDHVFHPLDARAKPALSLAHVFTNPGKVSSSLSLSAYILFVAHDRGDSSMLVPRGEHNCLVASYKEVKTCIDSVDRDLSNEGHSDG
ncbi:PAB-dependent poly(A)-specific ribonuclease subunit 3, partial [Ceratobasidium sp. 414]